MSLTPSVHRSSSQHPTELTNLRGANISEQRISGMTLRHVDLTDGILRDADLHGADLTGSILWDADLRGADLREATLERTFLNGARYDVETRFPHNFKPSAAGMRQSR